MEEIVMVLKLRFVAGNFLNAICVLERERENVIVMARGVQPTKLSHT